MLENSYKNIFVVLASSMCAAPRPSRCLETKICNPAESVIFNCYQLHSTELTWGHRGSPCSHHRLSTPATLWTKGGRTYVSCLCVWSENRTEPPCAAESPPTAAPPGCRWRWWPGTAVRQSWGATRPKLRWEWAVNAQRPSWSWTSYCTVTGRARTLRLAPLCSWHFWSLGGLARTGPRWVWDTGKIPGCGRSGGYWAFRQWWSRPFRSGLYCSWYPCCCWHGTGCMHWGRCLSPYCRKSRPERFWRKAEGWWSPMEETQG